MTLLPMKYKRKGKHIVLRTIRHGCVQINGYIFEPRELPIMPELNGRRCAFAVYWTWTGSYYREHCQMEDYVSLWGSEKMYQCIDEDSFNPAYNDWHKIVRDEDNRIRFMWWGLSRVQSVAFSKRREVLHG